VGIKKKLVFCIMILLIIIPLVYARDYGALKYGVGDYGVGEVPAADDSSSSSSSGGGGGGSGGGSSIVKEEVECSQDSDCQPNQYCFENECHNAECTNDEVCEENEVCHQYRCVKLFDVEIKEFESPVKLGDFFDFTYLIKGMADFNDDVTISFSIERDGETVTSGQDVIYLGSFEEKTKTTKLFLPSTVASGVYTFSVEVAYGNYKVKSFRTVEIIVGEEGTAEINLLPEKHSLVGSAMGWGRDKLGPFLLENLYFILAGLGIVVLSIIVIVLVKKHSKEPKRKQRGNKSKKTKFIYRERVMNNLKRIKNQSKGGRK